MTFKEAAAARLASVLAKIKSATDEDLLRSDVDSLLTGYERKAQLRTPSIGAKEWDKDRFGVRRRPTTLHVVVNHLDILKMAKDELPLDGIVIADNKEYVAIPHDAETSDVAETNAFFRTRMDVLKEAVRQVGDWVAEYNAGLRASLEKAVKQAQEAAKEREKYESDLEIPD